LIRDGQFEPFAFVPLDPSHLNKRSGKNKSKQVFEDVVHASKSGSQEGKRRNRKQRATYKKHTLKGTKKKTNKK